MKRKEFVKNEVERELTGLLYAKYGVHAELKNFESCNTDQLSGRNNSYTATAIVKGATVYAHGRNAQEMMDVFEYELSHGYAVFYK